MRKAYPSLFLGLVTITNFAFGMNKGMEEVGEQREFGVGRILTDSLAYSFGMENYGEAVNTTFGFHISSGRYGSRQIRAITHEEGIVPAPENYRTFITDLCKALQDHETLFFQIQKELEGSCQETASLKKQLEMLLGAERQCAVNRIHNRHGPASTSGSIQGGRSSQSPELRRAQCPGRVQFHEHVVEAQLKGAHQDRDVADERREGAGVSNDPL